MGRACCASATAPRHVTFQGSEEKQLPRQAPTLQSSGGSAVSMAALMCAELTMRQLP